MKKVKNKALWLGLVLALVACSTQQPPQQQPPQQPPQATATPQEIATGLQSLASEIQQAIQEIQSTLEGVVPLQLANQGLGLEDLKALPHLDLQKLLNTNLLHLTPLAAYDLPRGKIECTGQSCNPVGPSDDLEVRFRERSTDPWNKALADWNYSTKGAPSSTVWVHDPNNTRDTQEMPTKAFFALDLREDGTNQGEATFTARWRPSTCLSGNYLLEPENLSVQGFVDHPTQAGRLADLRKLNFTSSNTQVGLEWDLSLLVQGNTSGLATKGLIRALGTTTPGTCGSLLEKFDARSGEVDVELSTRNSSMRIAFTVTQVEEYPAVRFHLKNGYLRVDSKVVTFEGILDDQNNNCVPGENLTLRFAGGQTMSLEAFLIQHMGAQPCR